MKTISIHQRGGFTLLATVGALAIVATTVAVCYSTTAQSSRFADRGQDLTVVRAGAEGSLEYAYGVWKERSGQLGRTLTTTECNDNLTPPALSGATFSTTLSVSAADEYGAPVASPTAAVVDVVGFPGWKGRTYTYLANVGVRGSSTVGGAPLIYQAKRLFQYVTVQLFQTAYFYEGDFSIYRPPTMKVSGLTHTNRAATVSNTLSSGTLTFQSPVSSVLGWSNADPYRVSTWSGYASGNNQAATYLSSVNTVSRLEPLGIEQSLVLDTPPAGPYSPSGEMIGPDGDSDGNPNNDSFRELIEPPVAAQPDPTPIATRRLYNKAGIIVTINGTTKTVTTQNGTTLTSAQITTIQGAIATPTSMYDQREQKTIRFNNLDIGAVRTTLDAATNFNGVLYIHDITPTTTALPTNAIRLKNGGILPNNGLTVASQNGIYIQGDYNTGATTPALAATSVPSNTAGNPTNVDSPNTSSYVRKSSAVIGDAVMLLSNAWNDTNASAVLASRVAINTTYNTAILAGVMPSGYQPGGTAAQYGWSGGGHNYPRFLENWTGQYCTYFGSMVQLFNSTRFTGKWDTGNIYSPPIRCFNYDTNFDASPPPGSVDAVVISRGRMARY